MGHGSGHELLLGWSVDAVGAAEGLHGVCGGRGTVVVVGEVVGKFNSRVDSLMLAEENGFQFRLYVPHCV